MVSILGEYPNTIAGHLPLVGLMLVLASVGFHDVFGLLTGRYRWTDESEDGDIDEEKQAEWTLAVIIAVGRGLTFSGMFIYLLYRVIGSAV